MWITPLIIPDSPCSYLPSIGYRKLPLSWRSRCKFLYRSKQSSSCLCFVGSYHRNTGVYMASTFTACYPAIVMFPKWCDASNHLSASSFSRRVRNENKGCRHGPLSRQLITANMTNFCPHSPLPCALQRCHVRCFNLSNRVTQCCVSWYLTSLLSDLSNTRISKRRRVRGSGPSRHAE